MKKKWVHKARSFREAERFERQYYRSMSSRERVETVDLLRRMAGKLGRAGGGKRLRRVVTIVQLASREIRHQDQADLERLRSKKDRRGLGKRSS